jgi:hypothetical protein
MSRQHVTDAMKKKYPDVIHTTLSVTALDNAVATSLSLIVLLVFLENY